MDKSIEEPMVAADETEKKTGENTGMMVSPLNGAVCPTGAHPGNTGGKPGRSGRPPKDFVAWCQALIDDDDARAVFEARLKAGDLDLLKFGAAYAKGKPRETVELTGKDGGPIEQVWKLGEREIKF